MDLEIESWEEAHDKRTNPIRSSLLDAFAPEEREQIQQVGRNLSSFQVLKLKHELVELRREQYLLRDSYAEPSHGRSIPQIILPRSPILDAEIQVLPLHLPNSTTLMKKIWNKERFPIPSDFTEGELGAITKLLWDQANDAEFCIDFCNED